ncbi:MAG TPA: hypothetical protein VKV40_02650 [Ktedonobacteraceae bacterium]|nr:hypothetical protein [Ktedonobacteraceae bacterium]
MRIAVNIRPTGDWAAMLAVAKAGSRTRLHHLLAPLRQIVRAGKTALVAFMPLYNSLQETPEFHRAILTAGSDYA